jgi:hypothetical protein
MRVDTVVKDRKRIDMISFLVSSLPLLCIGPLAKGHNLDIISAQGVLQWAPSKGFPF